MYFLFADFKSESVRAVKKLLLAPPPPSSKVRTVCGVQHLHQAMAEHSHSTHTRTHAHTRARTHAHMHTCTHSHSHTHTHTHTPHTQVMHEFPVIASDTTTSRKDYVRHDVAARESDRLSNLTTNRVGLFAWSSTVVCSLVFTTWVRG